MSERKITLASNNIRIFPYSRNRVTDPFGRMMNEHNLTNLVKHFTDYDSFFVSCSSTGELARSCEFVIGGYFVAIDFSVDKSNIITTIDNVQISPAQFWLNGDVFVEIVRVNTSAEFDDDVDVTYLQLEGFDTTTSGENESGSHFSAITFTKESLAPEGVIDDLYRKRWVDDNGKEHISFKLFENGNRDVDNMVISNAMPIVPNEVKIKFDRQSLAPLVWRTF